MPTFTVRSDLRAHIHCEEFLVRPPWIVVDRGDEVLRRSYRYARQLAVPAAMRCGEQGLNCTLHTLACVCVCVCVCVYEYVHA